MTNLGVTARREPPVPQEPDVILRLPYDVAVTLRSMMAVAAGDPDTTYRAHTCCIADAIDSAGIRYLCDRFYGVIHASPLPEAR